MVYKYFKCPHCGTVSTAGSWNIETLKLCTNRQAKRTYRPIQQAGKNGKWYQCPECQQPSSISKIQPLHISEVLEEVAQ